MKALALALMALGLVAAGQAQARAHVRHYRQRLLPAPSPYFPEEFPPLPQGFTMSVTRIIGREPPPEARADLNLDTGRAVAERLAACWDPPEPARQGEASQVTLRLAFNRQGRVIGAPRITYAAAADGPDGLAALRRSILNGVSACTPLRFTPGLASAIAGVPFTIRFIARRSAPQH